MVHYSYEGPVYVFDRLYSPKWRTSTDAVSMAKAVSNIKFQAKTQMGLVKTARVAIDEKLIKEEWRTDG